MSTPENASSATPLLDPATGMKPGERYRVEPAEGGHPFEGFFLDGKYFLDAQLLTAVGWLEGRQFIYDQLDGSGEPVFAERRAGEISDLNLTVVNGPVLALTPVKVAAAADTHQRHTPPPEQAGAVPGHQDFSKETETKTMALEQASPDAAAKSGRGTGADTESSASVKAAVDDTAGAPSKAAEKALSAGSANAPSKAAVEDTGNGSPKAVATAASEEAATASSKAANEAASGNTPNGSSDAAAIAAGEDATSAPSAAESKAAPDASLQADLEADADADANPVDSDCPMVRSPINLMVTAAAAVAIGLITGFTISRYRR